MSPSQTYSNREVDSFLNRQEEAHKLFAVTLSRIEIQTKETNGKVAEIQRWRERMTGAGYITLLVVLPLMSWALYQVTQINDKVRVGVREALSSYEVQVNK
jgi:hypothetical protein